MYLCSGRLQNLNFSISESDEGDVFVGEGVGMYIDMILQSQPFEYIYIAFSKKHALLIVNDM